MLSSVDEFVLEVDDDEQEREGRWWVKRIGVGGERESFSIWLRLKSEKCLSSVIFDGIIAGGKDGSARTMWRNCCSLIVLNGSGDDDVDSFVHRGFFTMDWIWCGNERRAYGVWRMFVNVDY